LINSRGVGEDKLHGRTLEVGSKQETHGKTLTSCISFQVKRRTSKEIK